jgi:hypothetical protein
VLSPGLLRDTRVPYRQGYREGATINVPNNLQNGRTSHVTLTPVSWSAELNLALEEWVGQGRRLGAIARGAHWWIGDWLRFGNAKFGERYVRAAKITGYEPQTLMNMAYVASRFPVSRRREKLSWSHHAEVAALDADDQDQWLDRAESERLSKRCLRAELRHAQARSKRELPEETSSNGVHNENNGVHHENGSGHSWLECPQCGFRLSSGPPQTMRELADQLEVNRAESREAVLESH